LRARGTNCVGHQFLYPVWGGGDKGPGKKDGKDPIARQAAQGAQ